MAAELDLRLRACRNQTDLRHRGGDTILGTDVTSAVIVRAAGRARCFGRATTGMVDENTMTKVETNSKHGGARPGAGRKRGVPNRWPAALAKEIARLGDEVSKLRQQRRLEDVHGERILARLVAIERQLGLRDRIEVPRHTRRRPRGHD